MKPVLLALALTLGACTPSNVTPPYPDAGVAVQACGNLDHLQCPIGRDPLCVSRLELAVSENHTTAAKLECARAAPTKTALAECKSPYFACP